jgi:beta-glucanase (GH16 family)
MRFELPSLSVIIFCASMVAACSGAGVSKTLPAQHAPSAGGVPTDYTLVWSDEFDTPGLPDASKWGYDTFRNSRGWFNNELQYYSANRPVNARVESGQLIITARKESLSSAADYGGQLYTSARMVTNRKAAWTYGYFEVRAMLPCGRGTWPAIWMLASEGNWPDGGEIDIMEQLGKDPARIIGTIHSRQSGEQGSGGTANVPDACSAFHNYQMTWTADHILFGIDNVNYFEFKNAHTGNDATWPFDKPQYLILNLAIGGFGGLVDDSIFPAQMKIEHVRVYQQHPRSTD